MDNPERSAPSDTVNPLISQGRAYLNNGAAQEGLELLQRAYALDPTQQTCTELLLEALLHLGQLDQAHDVLDAAHLTAPHNATLVTHNSEIALRRGQLSKAEALLDHAIQISPHNIALQVRRGHIHFLAGEHEHASRLFEHVLARDPTHQASRSKLILAAAYHPSATTAALKLRERGLEQDARQPTLAAQPPSPPNTSPPNTGHPLKIGYVSATFCDHSATKITSAILLNHNPDRVQVHLYMTGRKRDAFSRKFRFAAHSWHSMAGLTDRAAAQRIHADQIDVLIDLDGHYQFGRPGIFRYRPAPVQLSGLGYVSGPSVSGIDHLITDTTIAPAGELEHFHEHPLHLPCAQPFALALAHPIAPSSLPPQDPGRAICFGSCARLDKISDQTISLWAQVLKACENTRLLLKNRFMADQQVHCRILSRFKAAGVDPSRVICDLTEPYTSYLAAYARIDIVLDTLPVTGGVTTLECLSQGVPVISLAGHSPMARIGASILSYLDLTELICETHPEFVRTAVTLATDPAALHKQRQRVVASHRNFSQDCQSGHTSTLEDMYRDLCQQNRAAPHKKGEEKQFS